MDDSRPSGALPQDHPLYAPGLKWRFRVGGNIPMWVPPAKDVKAGYLPKSLMLDRNASPHELALVCRKQWQDLLERRSGKPKTVRYTINWLIDRYLSDATSPYHRLKPDTQQSYRWECKRIRETVGEKRVDPKIEGGLFVPRRTGEDFRRWFQNWGHPPGRKPTPSRAVHCMAMLRTLFSYYGEIGGPGAKEARDVLSAMRFEKSGARSKAPTHNQVQAIVTTAVEMGCRSIAITTLAQFELIERRTHIIAQWHGDSWGYGWMWDGSMVVNGRNEWVGVTANWQIRYYQTKKGANLREFDLTVVQPLLTLLQETSEEGRQGPIIICEDTGQPWIKRRYQEKFREIARAAGVPNDI
jgi:hypothetical protein